MNVEISNQYVTTYKIKIISSLKEFETLEIIRNSFTNEIKDIKINGNEYTIICSTENETDILDLDLKNITEDKMEFHRIEIQDIVFQLEELKSNNKLSNSQKIAFQELQRTINKPNREEK